MIQSVEAVRKSLLSFGPAGPAASLGLHVVILAGVALFARPVALPEAVEQVVMVDLVTMPAPAAQASLAVPDVHEAAGQTETDDPGPPAAGSDIIEATTMLAGAALADPRNEKARAMLAMIVPSLRREQVCGIEAMEQIKLNAPDWSPECVISYAYADTRIEGNTVTATGAVVQNGADWYRLEYACMLGDDLASVTAFRYRIGDIVSAAECDRLGLAPCT